MSVTYYAANRNVDYNFGKTTFTVPTTYYFGLSTTAINIDGTGATEPSGGGYARVAFTNDKTNWGTASLGILLNALAVTFPESSASWGTITHIGIWDNLTGGNLWWYDVLTPSRPIASATTVLFAVGAVTVTMNNT
jgi:hypothetical protein